MKFIQYSLKYFSLLILTIVFSFLRQIFSNTDLMLFLHTFLSSFSLLFAFIPEAIIAYRANRKAKHKGSGKYIQLISGFKQVTVSPNKIFKNTKIFMFFIIIGSSRFIADMFFIWIAMLRSGLNSILCFSCLLITYFLCYLNSKVNLARHHALGFGIVLLATIIEIIIFNIDFSTIVNAFGLNEILFSVFFILFVFLSSSKEVIEKHLMTNYFYSSFILLLYEGIFSLLIIFLFLIIASNIDCNKTLLADICKNNHWSFFKIGFVRFLNFSSVESLMTWAYILFSFISSVFQIEMNKKLTPMHKYITDNMVAILINIYNLITLLYKETESHWTDLVYMSILVIISSIGCFIFHEYIIVKCFNLDKDTKVAIENRGIKEDLSYYELEVDGSSVSYQFQDDGVSKSNQD